MATPGYRLTAVPTYAPPYSRYFAPEYFSTTDLSIFFDAGDGSEPKYIDEITGLSYTLTERAVPVYGYASYTASRIVHGARLVQGQFSINMRPGDYMHELVNRIDAIVGAKPPDGSLEQFVRPDPQIDPDGYARWTAAQRKQYWDALASLKTSNSEVDQLRATEYFTGSGFTIMMISGDVDAVDLSRNSGRVRTIDNVHLFSTGQTLELTPDAIQETFAFLAVDINGKNRLAPLQ